ncbi:MAG TPA: zincin-like metallopeptidase domain-containing protein [Nitrospira sp.]
MLDLSRRVFGAPWLHPGAFSRHCRADIRHGGTRAYYAQEPDYLRMPPFEAFDSP